MKKQEVSEKLDKLAELTAYYTRFQGMMTWAGITLKDYLEEHAVSRRLKARVNASPTKKNIKKFIEYEESMFKKYGDIQDEYLKSVGINLEQFSQMDETTQRFITGRRIESVTMLNDQQCLVNFVNSEMVVREPITRGGPKETYHSLEELEDARAEVREFFQKEFGYTPERFTSKEVRLVEEWIAAEIQRLEGTDVALDRRECGILFGVVLGDAIINANGGEWIMAENTKFWEPAVRSGTGIGFAIQRVRKYIMNGFEDNLVGFYQMAISGVVR